MMIQCQLSGRQLSKYPTQVQSMHVKAGGPTHLIFCTRDIFFSFVYCVVHIVYIVVHIVCEVDVIANSLSVIFTILFDFKMFFFFFFFYMISRNI